MRYFSAHPVVLCAAALPCLVALPAQAADYLSLAEFQKVAFPDATDFQPTPLQLTPDQQAKITALAGGAQRPANWQVWQAKKGDAVLGFVVGDGVIGKFDIIGYAVALNTDASIRQVEILSYRESHGYEVRGKAWRNQFVGKSAKSPLRIGNDIQNISGATLSCTHLTDGIRRIAAMAQVGLVHG